MNFKKPVKNREREIMDIIDNCEEHIRSYYGHEYSKDFLCGMEMSSYHSSMMRIKELLGYKL